MDALGQLAELVERLCHDGPHVVEERGGSVRVRFDEATGDLEVDRDGDELLLDAVVQLTLDRTALLVVGEPARCASRPWSGLSVIRPRVVKGASTVENGGGGPPTVRLAPPWAAGLPGLASAAAQSRLKEWADEIDRRM